MKTWDIVEHIDKESKSGYPHDKKYKIFVDKARMKDPTTGEWVDAIIYAEDWKSTPFIREKQDFMRKFKKVEEK